jgi:hypothetical protein
MDGFYISGMTVVPAGQSRHVRRRVRAPATPSAVHPPKRLRLPRTTARSSSSLTGSAWRSAPAASCSRDRADAVLRDQGREGTPESGEDYRSCNGRRYHTMVNLVYQRVNNDHPRDV